MLRSDLLTEQRPVRHNKTVASQSVLVVELQDSSSVFRLQFKHVLTSPVVSAALQDEGGCSVAHDVAMTWVTQIADLRLQRSVI